MNTAQPPVTTILVVDDDARIRETLENLLTNPQHRLAFASSGAEGLRRASALMPDLILLDVMMPELDGFEVCRRIRSSTALAEIPVLMLTALDDRNSRLKGIEAGADDFIHKPFDSIELRARVRTITGLSRYRKLLAGRERSQWLVDNSQDAVLVVDSLLCVRYLNRAARTLLQLQPGADVEPDIHLMEVLHGHFRCEPRKAWATWLEHPTASPSPPLLLVRHATETSLASWHEVWVQSASGVPGGEIILQIRDITHFIQARLNQWSFERAVSHKLATPLTGVMGILDILRKDMIQQIHDTEVIEFIGLLGRSADRLHNAVKEVLRYAELTNVPLAGEGFSLTGLTQLIGAAAAVAGVEGGVADVEVELADNVWGLHVTLSERTVDLILVQLFENAVQFHPKRQPKIRLTVARDANPERVLFRMQDDGITLSSEQLQQVWEPYYQAEKLMTGQVPGMGLGLSRIAMLVAQSGGECWMENVVGGPGVVVCLTLPRVSTTDPDPVVPATRAATLR